MIKRILFYMMLGLVVWNGQVLAGDLPEIIEQELRHLPEMCYPDALQVGKYYHPSIPGSRHFTTACDILSSLGHVKRLSDVQKEKPLLALATLKKVCTKENSHDYIPLTTNYKKSTDLIRPLKHGISEAWRALAAAHRENKQSVTFAEIGLLRDALSLTARAVAKTATVVSPARKLGILRQFTGLKQPIIPNFFPEGLDATSSAETVEAADQLVMHEVSVPAPLKASRSLFTLDGFVKPGLLVIESDTASSSVSSASSVRPVSTQSRSAKRTHRSTASTKKKSMLVPGQTFMTSFWGQSQVTTLGDNIIDLESESSPSKRSRQQ